MITWYDNTGDNIEWYYEMVTLDEYIVTTRDDIIEW
jgi:hypothetical protein